MVAIIFYWLKLEVHSSYSLEKQLHFIYINLFFTQFIQWCNYYVKSYELVLKETKQKGHDFGPHGPKQF